MKTLQLYLLVLLQCIVVSAELLPSNRTLAKEASAVCTYDPRDNSYTLSVAITFNGDPVDRVQFLSGDTYVVDAQGNDNEVPCTLAEGAVSSSSYALYQPKVFQDGQTASPNACGGRRYQPATTTDQFVWTILTREHKTYGILTDMDKLYTVICTSGNSVTGVLTTQVQIFQEDINGTAVEVRPSNELVLLERDSGNTFSQMQQNGIEVGQEVKLRVKSVVKRPGFRQEYFDHWGVFVYSCDFRFTLMGTRTQFIGLNGCPADTVFSDLSTGFVHEQGNTAAYDINQMLFQTDTDGFVLLPDSPPNNIIYITCFVGFCYGPTDSDKRCTDYCKNPDGRRKRQVQTETFEQITLSVNIMEKPETTTQQVEQQSSNKTVLIAITSSIAALVLVLAAIVVAIVCCRFCAAQRVTSDDTSSVTSSRQNLPRHINSQNFGYQPK